MTRWLGSTAVFGLSLLMAACGGGGSNSSAPPAPVSISVSSANATVYVGEKQTFSATVSSATNTTVTWSVSEPTGGTITATGTYTAPLTAGTYHVVATAAADTSKSALITITVPQVTVMVSPATANLSVTQTTAFTATVTNSNNATVTWSVAEANGGTFSGSGTYTPPMHAGSYHIKATANSDGKTTGTAVATVSAPAPIFSSMPPATATEGSAYNYAIVATDPAGGAVTYSITAAPVGATVSGTTLTWTPSHTQSRSVDDFVLVANTAEGGTATQSWSVTPAGTVTATKGVVHHLPDGSATVVPFDFSTTANPFGAFIPDGSGGFTWTDGVGKNGSFTVAGVPAGHYWLCWIKLGNRNVCLWTQNSSVDFSTHTYGRVIASASNTTLMNVAVTTATTVQPFSDWYEMFTPNADSDYVTQIGSSGTSITDSFSWTGLPLLDSSQGDLTYLTHLKAGFVGSIGYSALVEATPATALSVVNNSSNSFTGTAVAPANTRTLRFSIGASQFQAQRAKVNPLAVSAWLNAGIGLLRSDPSYGSISYLPTLVLMSQQGPITADFDTGDLIVGDPYPQTWVPLAYVSDNSSVTYNTAHFGARDYWFTNESWTTQLPTATVPAGPVLSPVENATINGTGLFQAQPSGGTSYVLSWNPPLTGTPTGYYVSVIAVSGGFIEARYFTTSTSIQLPPGAVNPGIQYVFSINAESSPGVNYETSPLRQSFPYAHSSTASGLITP
jgi:hypothetical protein